MARWDALGIEEETRVFAEKVINLIRVEELYQALQEFRNQAKREGRNEQILQKSKAKPKESPGQSIEFECRLGDGGDLGSGEGALLQGGSKGSSTNRFSTRESYDILGIPKGSNWSF